MKEGVFSIFRELGKGWRASKVKIEITLKNDRVLSALGDPIFRTITMATLRSPRGALPVDEALLWIGSRNHIARFLTWKGAKNLAPVDVRDSGGSRQCWSTSAGHPEFTTKAMKKVGRPETVLRNE
jgi:hypothetical protein